MYALCDFPSRGGGEENIGIHLEIFNSFNYLKTVFWSKDGTFSHFIKKKVLRYLLLIPAGVLVIDSIKI